MSVVAEASDRKQVLVVDDEMSVREVLAEGLGAFGFETRTAAGGREALDIVRSKPVHLVLSDIDMPEMSGLELLKQLKRHDPDLDVIMVTGVVDTDTAVGAIRDGASDYVTKPFNLDEVRIVVERTLEKRRLVLENRAYQQHLEEKVEERTREVVEKKREVERLYRELRDSYEDTLQALVTALELRDNETEGHSQRVVDYAITVGRQMGLEEPELTRLRQGAILHDIGKIGVPDSILHKPGVLDEREWSDMRRHPEMGYRMLSHIPFLRPALDIVLCHQERWDGSGYPRALRGEEIPLGARIFAVVDTLDAMTSDRPYRFALTLQRAREEIREFAGRQFDPAVVEAFLAIPIETWQEIRRRAHEQRAAVLPGSDDD